MIGILAHAIGQTSKRTNLKTKQLTHYMAPLNAYLRSARQVQLQKPGEFKPRAKKSKK